MTVESRKKKTTAGPPTRSSDRLAPKPIVVKNAIISGDWSVVVNVKGDQFQLRLTVMNIAISKPPTTGAGML